jgi:RNA polymerase sigma factor (sigma-70 family)
MGATPAELREAERGFNLWLRRRFSATWIAENASDLMGQANVEYVEWLTVNPPARNPVGWLLRCAERRAKNLLDTQTRRPTPAPLDAVIHVADENTPTPEETALERDRQERLRQALGFLPEKERKLLALVYFGDCSIREAGRKLGWQKSAADRHHNWAMEKLRALVGDDRSVLSPATLGLVAWLLAYGERGPWRRAIDAALTPGREALASGLEAGEWTARQLGELGRRLSSLGEPASVAASNGGGRLVGACGVAVATVVCGIAASGALPSGEAALAPGQAVSVPQSVDASRGFPVPDLPSAPPPPVAPKAAKAPSASATVREGRQRARATKSPAPRATIKQTVNEFGVESGSASGSESISTPEGSESPSSPSPSSGGSSAASRAKAGNGPEFAQ